MAYLHKTGIRPTQNKSYSSVHMVDFVLAKYRIVCKNVTSVPASRNSAIAIGFFIHHHQNHYFVGFFLIYIILLTYKPSVISYC